MFGEGGPRPDVLLRERAPHSSKERTDAAEDRGLPESAVDGVLRLIVLAFLVRWRHGAGFVWRSSRWRGEGRAGTRSEWDAKADGQSDIRKGH